MAKKEHRHFHYDPDTGKSTPVQPVKVKGGEVLIPLDAYKQIKRDAYGLDDVHPDVADSTIDNWESEED
jgi:hypothetical protein